MKTYTQAIALLNSLTKTNVNDTATNTFLAGLYNDSIRTTCNIRGGKWWFLETQVGVLTVAGQRMYATPKNIRKINDLTVTVGETIYRPQPVYDQGEWSKLQAAQLGSDDATQYYFVQGDNFYLYPIPASDSLFITITGRMNVRDQSIADYTTGTITTATNGSTGITGTGTSWTSSMTGRYIKIANSNTANNGDGMWYKILTVSSATSLVLVNAYQGTSITAGTAPYTIGEVSPIPEAYDVAPIWRTMAIYSQINDPLHPTVANQYWRLYDGGQEAGLSNTVGGLIGQMLENEGAVIEDVYLSPNHRDSLDPNYPPRDLSGFN